MEDHRRNNPKKNININVIKDKFKDKLPQLAPQQAEKTSKTPPPPTYEEPKQKYNFKMQRYFDDNVIVLNPNIDCSDKELHQRNGFKGVGKNLVSFLKNGDKVLFVKDVFRPTQLGAFTKDNSGVISHVFEHKKNPNFKKGKIVLKKENENIIC